jgi:hypothetical protein
VLQALAPSLLELRVASYAAPTTGHRALLLGLADALPDMSLVGLSALPSLVSSRGAPNVAEHFATPPSLLDSLTLLRSEGPSPQPLSTASLTRLNIMAPLLGLHLQSLLFLAPFTTQIKELHLDLSAAPQAHVVPVAALPPHLTALFCTHALLQLPGSPGDAHAAAAAAGATAGCSSGKGGLWEGLQQLHTLELQRSGCMSVFVGGGLPDLLLRTPNLKRLVCPADFRPGCAGDAARLRGCTQELTHLSLRCGYDVAAGAEVEQVCEWVGSLRHLRQLHLERDDIPGPFFAQVSRQSPRLLHFRNVTPFQYILPAL